MVKRFLIQYFISIVCFLAFSGQLYAINTPSAMPNYLRLLDFIEKEDLSDPLMVFGGTEENFDRRLNQENIAYINGNSELLHKIQSVLKGEHLGWRLNTSFKQLWVVPESRDEYAHLFERYCRDAVAYLLVRIAQPNPYRAISTLKGPLPDYPQGNAQGITAYLVHNIADEYIEEYLFFDQDDDGAMIKIKLSNREFDGKIGSYTSKLKIGPDNRFEFIHEKFTLWQNSAQNPYNVFIVPIEETLHIILRSATEQAMQEELMLLKPEKLHEVNRVIDHWMAVEEAVVGGLVWQIMPDLLDQVAHGMPDFSLAQTMAERDEHSQYRYLEEGIALIEHLGVDQTVALYQNSAQEFQAKLLNKFPKIESAQVSNSFGYVN